MTQPTSGEDYGRALLLLAERTPWLHDEEKVQFVNAVCAQHGVSPDALLDQGAAERAELERQIAELERRKAGLGTTPDEERAPAF